MSVVFYTRMGCHLCDDAREMLEGAGVEYRTIDVDDDRETQRAYGERVPVIEAGGVVIAEGNMRDVPLARLLSKVR